MKHETTSIQINPLGCIPSVLGIALILILCSNWSAINTALVRWLGG